MAAIAAIAEIARRMKPVSTFVADENDPEKNLEAVADMGKTAASFFVFVMVFNVILTLVAFYLAFKCIRNGGNAVGHLLGACCCGVLYIAYALAMGC